MALRRDPDLSFPAIDPLLHDRWSPRAFDAEHTIDDTQLASLIEAARWAPSAGNTQPWGFIVGVRGDATFTAFYETLARGNQSWVHRASAVILTVRQVASGPDRELAFGDYALYDLGQAAAHLSLQAHALGLHAHQFAGFDHAAAQDRFAIPAHWAATTGIAIGRIASPDVLDASTREKELRPRTRRPVHEFTFTGAWGDTPFAGSPR